MDWAASFSRGRTKKCKDRVLSDLIFNSNILEGMWSECVHDKLCINVASFTEMKRNSGDCDALAAHHRESAGIFEKVNEVTVRRPIKTDSSPNGRDRN